MKKFGKIAALVAALGTALALCAVSCSNSSDTPTPTPTPAATYTVTCGSFANGSVAASPATAAEGTEITLTASPATGYELATLTVTAADSTAVATSGSGNTRTFTMPAKDVTVTAAFSVIGEYKKVDTQTISGTPHDLVTFGLGPQTIKADSVTVNESVTETHGAFTYCKGSDGEWYVKQAEKWFKVEPIKWRVLSENYFGAKLLLAESILTGGMYYLNEYDRGTVCANNYKYSTIRAWLNGSYEADDTQATTHDGKGFLQSAFTAAQRAAIPATTVDNSAASTTDVSGTIAQVDESHACANTIDKIFLLSEKEVTTSAYGFDVYYARGTGNKRIRATTDFAKATGADGLWWLRSPTKGSGVRANCVNDDGGVKEGDSHYGFGSYVDRYRGVVPALSIAN